MIELPRDRGGGGSERATDEPVRQPRATTMPGATAEPLRQPRASNMPGPRTPRQWESSVDRQIREAEERGEFDNLPGLGKPLRLEAWDAEWGLAFHVLKNAGETLPWIALGQEIDTARAKLNEFLGRVRTIPYAERARARELYLCRAAELDKLLEEYAFSVPIRHLERGRLPRHIAAAQFDAALTAPD